MQLTSKTESSSSETFKVNTQNREGNNKRLQSQNCGKTHQQILTAQIPNIHRDPTSAFITPQNSESPPGPYDFIEDPQPVTTYKPKPRKLKPHIRS